MSKRLHIDIESYSSVKLDKAGLYKYAESPDFQILLVAYAVNDEPVQIVDLAMGEKLPEWFIYTLLDHSVTKVAHNAAFERVCFTHWLRREGILKETEWLNPHDWDCTMVKAARCGLPMSLKQVGEALGFERQKMSEGKDLIQVFCTPHKTTGMFGGTRIRPEDRPEDWATFKAYCVRDVDVERQIDDATAWYTVTDDERELYTIDQTINDRGVRIDMQLAREAARMDATLKAKLLQKGRLLSGLDNPGSTSQVKAWLAEQTGEEVKSLNKNSRADLMKSCDSKLIQEVLDIQAQTNKTSCAKYYTMLEMAGKDDRARGVTQFYGTRTGRWAGRTLQMQNLPQNHFALEELDFARNTMKAGDLNTLELCFGNVPDVMSQLIRTAFIAPEGKTFAVCDFSAIEARVLAWMAGEDWVLDTFRKGGDIYCATASQMFHVPVEKHGCNAELRQRGKVAVLALGYQGGVGALDQMGGARLGMTEDEERETVTMWRDANPNIVNLWYEFDNAAKAAAIYGKTVKAADGRFTFRKEGTTMTVELPSGRKICYPEMTESINRFGNRSLKFRGLSTEDKKYTVKKWTWIETYGGKITENITQAVARDCLAHVMKLVEAAGYPVVFHVHDELICEVSDGERDLTIIEDLFKNIPAWAEGLPLKGAGYVTPYYLKD